jgi:hypothetical protein
VGNTIGIDGLSDVQERVTFMQLFHAFDHERGTPIIGDVVQCAELRSCTGGTIPLAKQSEACSIKRTLAAHGVRSAGVLRFQAPE